MLVQLLVASQNVIFESIVSPKRQMDDRVGVKHNRKNVHEFRKQTSKMGSAIRNHSNAAHVFLFVWSLGKKDIRLFHCPKFNYKILRAYGVYDRVKLPELHLLLKPFYRGIQPCLNMFWLTYASTSRISKRQYSV